MWEYNLGLRFSKIAKVQPNSSALIIEKNIHKFSDLDKKTNQICNWLIKKNLTLGNTICITSEKNFIVFSLMIACLKMGITYTFLDRKSPFLRLKKIIDDVNPSAIIVDDVLKNNLISKELKTDIYELCNISQEFSIEKETLFNFDVSTVSSSTVAYLMFTSGSTGRPKGVAISHGNLVSFSNWCKEEYDIRKNDVVTNLNPLFFDNSVFDIYGGLFNGSCLLPIPRTTTVDAKKTINLLEKNNATIWFSVPSLLTYIMSFLAIKKNSLTSLKKIIFGGEGFPKNSLKKLYDIVGDRIELVNVYGPTECTCICSSYNISKFDFSEEEMKKLAPLGKKLSKNFFYLILDKKHKLVPHGEVGELFIGGDNVGLGYFNSPEETKKKYIQNPTHNFYRDIVYKSGDMVYIDSLNKFIYYSSRVDNQIKFHGYRIELNEIENVLGSMNKVQEVAVTFGRKNGNEEITAWVVHSSNMKELKKQLFNLLPSYMIPKKFIEMKELPKNNNGKINRICIKSDYYDKQ